MKTYTLKPTKKQLEVMKKFWAILRVELEEFNMKVSELEENMQKETKIEDIEFFNTDGSYVGIGNLTRTMKLFQAEELEK